MKSKSDTNLFSLALPVGAPSTEWEGMTYVAIRGSHDSLNQLGIGKKENDFGDAYVSLHNKRTGKHCGAIVKKLEYHETSALETDPCLLSDLSAEIGSSLEISALSPVPASQVRLLASNTELATRELQNLCATYLARQSLCAGQRKSIHLFSGEKFDIEITDVQPQPMCIYTNTTELVIDNAPDLISTNGLDAIGGLADEISKLRERINLSLNHPKFFSAQSIPLPRGILLSGPPGCGKTMMARAVALETDVHLLEINGLEALRANYSEGEKVVSNAFVEAAKKAPAILLIDDIDAIGNARDATRGAQESRLVNTLLTAIDEVPPHTNIIVIGTTNAPSRLDPALCRPGRFDHEIQIGVPDKARRLDILNKKTRHITSTADVDLEDIARRTHGFVGADIALLCREAAITALTARYSADNPGDNPGDADGRSLADVKIEADDFEQTLKRIKPSALREFAVEVPGHLDWHDVGGLENLKDTLVEEVITGLNDPTVFEQVGIKPTRGLLLYGPPGTGKTLIARVIANQAEANFISIKGPEVLSKWVGESEQRIRHLFVRARESSPCIIFFDEIDAIAATRGQSFNDTADRVVNQLLTEMDGFDSSRHVCVIGATNRIDTLDPALLRPGRFDHQIEVPMPDTAGLNSIYRIHCLAKPVIDCCDYNQLAARSRGFSGAHVAEACRRAALSALRASKFCMGETEITQQQLLTAIDQVRKTITDIEEPRIGFTSEI